MIALAVAAALAALAIALSRAERLQLERDLAVAAVRSTVQLAAVGAIVTLVFEHAGLAAGFIALMLTAATLTARGRLEWVPQRTRCAGAAIAAGAGAALVPLLLAGAFSLRPRELIPIAGILIGGSMAATSVTGRRLVAALADAAEATEARLALGVPVREALSPSVREATATGLVAGLDQTKNAGLVVLPGTFVGLILGGASPAEAARVQLVVLLSLLAVQLVAAVVLSRLVVAAVTLPGERVARRPR